MSLRQILIFVSCTLPKMIVWDVPTYLPRLALWIIFERLRFWNWEEIRDHLISLISTDLAAPRRRWKQKKRFISALNCILVPYASGGRWVGLREETRVIDELRQSADALDHTASNEDYRAAVDLLHRAIRQCDLAELIRARQTRILASGGHAFPAATLLLIAAQFLFTLYIATPRIPEGQSHPSNNQETNRVNEVQAKAEQRAVEASDDHPPEEDGTPDWFVWFALYATPVFIFLHQIRIYLGLLFQQLDTTFRAALFRIGTDAMRRSELVLRILLVVTVVLMSQCLNPTCPDETSLAIIIVHLIPLALYHSILWRILYLDDPERSTNWLIAIGDILFAVAGFFAVRWHIAGHGFDGWSFGFAAFSFGYVLWLFLEFARTYRESFIVFFAEIGTYWLITGHGRPFNSIDQGDKKDVDN